MVVFGGLCNLYIMGDIFSAARFLSDSPNFKNFWEGVSFFGGPCGLYIMGGIFSAVRLPADSPNFFYFGGRCFVFRGLRYWYIMRGFFPATPPQQGTLHDGFLVRANSAVRRRKEPYIRNPGIPSPSKQGTLHKEPLPAVKRFHRKEGYRRFRPASAVRLSAQARFRAAKTFESR